MELDQELSPASRTRRSSVVGDIKTRQPSAIPVKDIFDGSDAEAMQLLEEYKGDGISEASQKFLKRLLDLDNDLDRLHVLNKQAWFSAKALEQIIDSLGISWSGFIGSAFSSKPKYSEHPNYNRLVILIEQLQKTPDLLKKPYSSLSSASSFDKTPKQQFIIGLLQLCVAKTTTSPALSAPRKDSRRQSKPLEQQQIEKALATIDSENQQRILIDLIYHRKELYQRINPSAYTTLYCALLKRCLPHMKDDEETCSFYKENTFSNLEETREQELFCIGLLSLAPFDQLEILNRQYQLSSSGGAVLKELRSRISAPHLQEFDVTDINEQIRIIQTSSLDLQTENLTATPEKTKQFLFCLLYEPDETRQIKLLLAQQQLNPSCFENLSNTLLSKRSHLVEVFRRYESTRTEEDLNKLAGQIAALQSLPNLHKTPFNQITEPAQKHLFLLGLVFLEPKHQEQILLKQSVHLTDIQTALEGIQPQFEGHEASRYDATMALLQRKRADQQRSPLGRLFAPSTQDAKTVKAPERKATPTKDPKLLWFIAAYLINYHGSTGGRSKHVKSMIEEFLAGTRPNLTLEEIQQHGGKRTKQIITKIPANLDEQDPFVLNFAAQYFLRYMKAPFFCRNPFQSTMKKHIQNFILNETPLSRELILAHKGGRSKDVAKEIPDDDKASLGLS